MIQENYSYLYPESRFIVSSCWCPFAQEVDIPQNTILINFIPFIKMNLCNTGMLTIFEFLENKTPPRQGFND